MLKRCMGCMKEYEGDYEICPSCGYIDGTPAREAFHMEPGSILSERYIVGKVLGFGGFGVTYIGWDALLENKVAIKEFLPGEFSTRIPGQTQVTIFSGEKEEQFNSGIDKFIDEAKRLAKFQNVDGIVKIYDSFRENNTAYIVMEFLEGESLKEKIERDGKMNGDEAIGLLLPMLTALGKVHEEGIIHRDVSPDNIFITTKGEVRLLDFGAARYATTTHSKSLSVIIKPGYAPEEQYRSRGDQGTWTDVYASAATLYKMVTGVTPEDSLERRAKDKLKLPSKLGAQLSDNQENAIMNALNIRIEDRTQTAEAFIGELTSTEKVKRNVIRIKDIDLGKWPLWAKITVPSIAGIVAVCTILVLTGVISLDVITGKDISVPSGMTRVPNVYGETREDAEKIIGDNGLTLAEPNRDYSKDLVKGVVLAQSPFGGSVVQEDSEVVITVSEGEQIVEVPDVTGYLEEEAETILTEYGFIVNKTDGEDLNQPDGIVLSQSIAAGEEIKGGETIIITVNRNSDSLNDGTQTTVPNLVGMEYDDAIKSAKAKKLYVAVVSKEYSSRPKNEVIAQATESGTRIASGSIVELTVSLGSGAEITVPQVIGMVRESAEIDLKSRGFVVTVQEKDDAKYAAGTVCDLSIPEGTSVKQGTEITIYVSKGETVTVPNVIGKTQSEATRAIGNTGLAVTIEEQSSETVEKGNVIYQSVPAGSKVSRSTTVVITISTGKGETPKVQPTIKGIRVVTQPTKTVYYVGDKLNTSGLVVEAIYSDSSTTQISGWNVSADLSTNGTKNVSITYQGMSTSYPVTVNTPGVSFSQPAVSVKKGESQNLSVTTYPSGLALSFSSSDPGTVSVSGGTVTGKGSGSATITATISYNGIAYHASCTVTVDLHTYTVELNSNGGSAVNSITVVEDSDYGSLPTPTKDYCDFAGWYTSESGGTRVTESSTIASNSNHTLYAQWESKSENGEWVLASAVPSGAKVTSRKWTYTTTTHTESTNPSLDGYTQEGSYWKQTNSGSFNYASFPSGFDTNNSIYKNTQKSPYTAFENSTSKRTVTTSRNGFVYWHWMYSTKADAYDRIISNAAGYSSPYNDYNYKNFGAFISTKNYQQTPAERTWYYVADRTSNADTQGSYYWYRFDYNKCSWTDYQNVFKYKKDETKESATAVQPAEGISNIQEWVHYMPK